MTDDQAARVLEIALRDREAMAEQVASLILLSPIEGFIPEAARGAFAEWCAANDLPGLV